MSVSLPVRKVPFHHVSIGQAEMEAGDVFEIHTPGGGGFGAA